MAAKIRNKWKNQKMKFVKLFKPILFGLLVIGLANCNKNSTKIQNQSAPIVGTWKLISGTIIKGKDTLITDYTKEQEMIKIINETHFSFLRHDLKKGKDSNAIFVAGGGKYTLDGNKYIEHLEYFNTREWEGNSFELEFKIKGDILITKGVEKIEELNVNYINIEKFHRIVE